MIIIKIKDNEEIRRLDIEMERQDTTEIERLFANSISEHIDKLIKK